MVEVEAEKKIKLKTMYTNQKIVPSRKDATVNIIAY